MAGFLQKVCLVFTIVLSTDVESIVGKPVYNAKLNPLLEVGYRYVYKGVVFC